MNTVNVETHTKSIKIKTDYKTTIEDLIIETCKTLDIGPIARHLFAVRIKSTTTWLHLNAYVEQIPSNTASIVTDTPENARALQAEDPEIAKLIDFVHENGNDNPDLFVEDGVLYRRHGEKVVFLPNSVRSKDFEFRMRFNVPDFNRLLSIDRNAFDYLFNQIRSVILRHQLPKWIYEKYKSELNGLSVLDMYRTMLEQGLSKEDVINGYKDYIPRVVLKKHRFFVKKPIIKHLDVLLQSKFKYDSPYVKCGYLDQFIKMVPDHLSESFHVVINNIQKPTPATIIVDPYHKVHPGVAIKQDEKIEHVCTIEDLCYINIRKEGTVEISRKNGIPLYLKFHSVPDMMSFVSLLDGYYRLTVKWTFNLCRDIPTPSLHKLQPLKCHGPISGEFAYRKLEEKRNNEVGCYILRESDLEYDKFYIDVCTKTSAKPVTFKIETTNNKQYRLCCNDKITYPSIPALVAAHKSEPADFILRECLPPSDYDQSNLLICQVNNCAYSQKPVSKKELPMTNPLCIDGRTLMIFKNKPKEGRNQLTTVYRAVWNTDNIKKNVAIKVLKESHKDKHLQEFLSLTSRWGFVNSSDVVKFYGFSLSSPVSMVMEHLPLGALDRYLENVDNRLPIKEVDLVEAATYLANAIWYLEEAGFVHGNIRCRKILVSCHTPNSFKVKLSDPGLHDSYTDTDLHWIPPEYHNERLNEARNSVMADVWAYGTTLWEMFSLGKCPPVNEGNVIKKFYKSGKILSQPPGCPDNVFQLMRECWISDPEHRKRPQEAMRDINQVLYQVYNARQGHSYTPIIPFFDGHPDNVSNKSKESDDVSSSLFSENTLTTFVDDGEERCSAKDLLHMNDNITSDILFPTKISHQTYQRFENTQTSIMSIFEQPECSLGDDAISSMQSIFELDREWKLILNGRIGEGFHGEVFRGVLQHWHDEEDTQKVAVKKLKTYTMTRDKLSDFDREINIMKQLDHPNIVKIKGIIRDPDLCLVLEYIDHGSLRCYLNINRERLSTIHLLKFALDVAKGMAYLSDKKIVHRDLAARNILVVNETHVKISDFGLAQFIGNDNYYTFKTERQLPIEWYAPESIEYGKFSPQSDVWSYGVTLYEMFSCGEDPRLPLQQQSVENILNALKNGERLQCPDKCPRPVYEETMRECWQYEATKRPTFHKLCKIIDSFFHPTAESDPEKSMITLGLKGIYS